MYEKINHIRSRLYILHYSLARKVNFFRTVYDFYITPQRDLYIAQHPQLPGNHTSRANLFHSNSQLLSCAGTYFNPMVKRVHKKSKVTSPRLQCYRDSNKPYLNPGPNKSGYAFKSANNFTKFALHVSIFTKMHLNAFINMMNFILLKRLNIQYNTF